MHLDYACIISDLVMPQTLIELGRIARAWVIAGAVGTATSGAFVALWDIHQQRQQRRGGPWDNL